MTYYLLIRAVCHKYCTNCSSVEIIDFSEINYIPGSFPFSWHVYHSALHQSEWKLRRHRLCFPMTFLSRTKLAVLREEMGSNSQTTYCNSCLRYSWQLAATWRRSADCFWEPPHLDGSHSHYLFWRGGGRGRPRDRGSSSQHPAVRLIASRRRTEKQAGQREKETRLEETLVEGRLAEKSPFAALQVRRLLDQTRLAHHGRLWQDRRWAVLLLPPQPHLGDLLRAGKTRLSLKRIG